MSAILDIEDDALVPFVDTGELIEAMYEEIRALIAFAGRRRQEERPPKSNDAISFFEEEDEDEAALDWRALGHIHSQIRDRNTDRLSLSNTDTLPWLSLVEGEGLDVFEQQVIWLLFFKAVAPDFRQYCADWGLDHYGTERGREMCVGNVLQILCPGSIMTQMSVRRYFSVEAPLVAHHMVRLDTSMGECPSILEAEIALTSRMVAWISGDTHRYVSDSSFHVEHPADSLDQVVLPTEQLDRVIDLVTHYDFYRQRRRELGMDQTVTYGQGLVILEYGPPGTGKTLLARALANYTKRPLISLRHGANRWTDKDEELQTLFREARLQKGIVFIDECENLCSRDSSELPTLLVELERAECIVLMATNRPQELAPELDRRFTLKMTFALPDAKARQKIWQMHLSAMPLAEDVDLKHLADAYPLAGGYVKNAVLAAVNLAMARAGEAELSIGMAELEQGIRYQEKHVGRISRCRTISQPDLTLEQAFLSPQAKEQVEYLVRMVQNGPGILRRYDLADAPIKGCKVLLQSSCRLTGLQAIHAWASVLNKTLEVIDMHYLFRNDGDEADYCKPQEVFAATSGTGHLLALIDGRQRLGVDLEPSQEMQAFYHELAAFEGTALVLTNRAMSQRFSARIFHEKRQLADPDQAVQRAYGQKVLGVDAGSEEAADWEELTAKYQLTLEQIQCIVQRMGLLQAGTGNGYSNRMLLEQAISLEVGVGQGQWLFGDRFE